MTDPVDLSTPAAAFLSGFDCGRAVGHWEGWTDGYVEGYDVAEPAVRQAVEAEWRGRHEVAAAIAKMIAAAGPYDALADRRGEPERAQAQRDLLAGRGIS